MKFTPKHSLLALTLGALALGLSLGWSPSVRATVPCPLGSESAMLTLVSVTVDGQPQADLSAYAGYRVSLHAAAAVNGPLILGATAPSAYVTEEYANAP